MVIFLTHNRFDRLMRAANDGRGAIMVVLLKLGYSGSTCAAIADALLSGRYDWTYGGVVVAI